MSNSNFVSVGNTLLSSSSLKPPLMQMGVVEPSYLSAVADCSAAAVNLSTDSSLLLAALNNPNGLMVVNSETVGRDLFLGTADTAAVAAKLQSILGLSTAGQSVTLKFVFLVPDIAELLKSGGSTHVPISLNGGAGAASQIIKVGGAAAAGACEYAIVRATATNVTAGAQVITFNILQQSV